MVLASIPFPFLGFGSGLRFSARLTDCESSLASALDSRSEKDSEEFSYKTVVELALQGLNVPFPLHYHRWSPESDFWVAEGNQFFTHPYSNHQARFKVIARSIEGVIEPFVLILREKPGKSSSAPGFFISFESLYPVLKKTSVYSPPSSNSIHSEWATFERSLRKAGYQQIDFGIQLANRDFFAQSREGLLSLSHFKLKWNGSPLIPVFQGVYVYWTEYLYRLMEEVIPRLKPNQKILVMGSGSGFDAAMIATHTQQRLDAIDINPLAVANTWATAIATQTTHLIQTWQSDLFNSVPQKYDLIAFDSPIPVSGRIKNKDPNRFDPNGEMLARLLKQLPDHLLPNGRLYLMTTRSFPSVIPLGLEATLLRTFSDDLAIFEVKVQFSSNPGQRALPVLPSSYSNSSHNSTLSQPHPD